MLNEQLELPFDPPLPRITATGDLPHAEMACWQEPTLPVSFVQALIDVLNRIQPIIRGADRGNHAS